MEIKIINTGSLLGLRKNEIERERESEIGGVNCVSVCLAVCLCVCVVNI